LRPCYAPEHGQLIERTFEPVFVTAQTLTVYERANELAQVFWRRVAEDVRMSAEFRAIARANEAAVRSAQRS
jgi:predicted acetyltransferase